MTTTALLFLIPSCELELAHESSGTSEPPPAQAAFQIEE